MLSSNALVPATWQLRGYVERKHDPQLPGGASFLYQLMLGIDTAPQTTGDSGSACLPDEQTFVRPALLRASAILRGHGDIRGV